MITNVLPLFYESQCIVVKMSGEKVGRIYQPFNMEPRLYIDRQPTWTSYQVDRKSKSVVGPDKTVVPC